MFLPDKIEFNGASGKTYSFEVYPKSAQLPDTVGVFILTYSHPRGHLSGFQVNILSMGIANNLNSVIVDLRQDESLLKECWNYSCIMCLDKVTQCHECIDDLKNIKCTQC
jgi:hypothetical protein